MSLKKQIQAYFPEEEIEWKVQTSGIKSDGSLWCLVVPFIRAESIRNRLDDIVGPENWKPEKYEQNQNGGLQAGLSIRINGEWITKYDGGDSPEYSKIKGEYTSAFRRAAAVWGFGRYLIKVGARYADVSMKQKPGWIKAFHQDKKSKQHIVYWWSQPALPKEFIPSPSLKERSEVIKKYFLDKFKINEVQLQKYLGRKGFMEGLIFTEDECVQLKKVSEDLLSNKISVNDIVGKV